MIEKHNGRCEKCGSVGIHAHDGHGRYERIASEFTDGNERALVLPLMCTNETCGHRWSEVYIYDHDEI